MKMILASGSPRRKELLGLLELSFEVRVSDVEEDFSETDPVLLTESLSRQKAEDVFHKMETEKGTAEDFCVIGADTVVFAKNAAGENEILGKPLDRADAGRMIKNIQGSVHTVCTGVAVFWKKGENTGSITFSEQTRVYAAEMSKAEIEQYLDTDEPYDKAGAYGIQGRFSKFIEKIEGDYFNVVGLPVHRLYRVLAEHELL